jgi:cytochrome oxidase Cu insertion factor (SCO1/SenC/PrrC family)/thiol-disulfide isomerase/thioredoxin
VTLSDIARRTLVLISLLAVSACLLPALARADGDPGSDVLVYQPLFAAADANISIPDQVRLDGMLGSAARSGAPIRIAIIARRDDLGSVTALWRRPQAYARFLGIELSLTYKGLLLVVMPDGFGVNWPGHSTVATLTSLSGLRIGPGGSGLAAAAQAGAQRLDAQRGVKLTPGVSTRSTAASRTPRHASSIPTITIGSTPATSSTSERRAAPVTGSWPGGPVDEVIALAAAVVFGLAVLAVVVGVVRDRRAPARDRRGRYERRWRPAGLLALGRTAAAPRLALDGPAPASLTPPQPSCDRHGRRPRWMPALAVTLGAAALAAVLVVGLSERSESGSTALALNPSLDPGSALSGRPAPGFTLFDQSGRRISLSSFRGKVTLLDFNDSECTTICPLTTTAMLDAKRMLGPAAKDVQLLGVDANPKATAIDDVLSYTQLHGLTGKWQFLTGSESQLRRVWHAYGIQASIQRGLISHTPALYVIDRQGRLRQLYMTQQSYSAVGQFGQILAREVSSLLPGRPAVRSHLSYRPVPTIPPTRSVTLPRAGGGRVSLGPGKPHLYLFFDTWDREVTSIAGELEALNTYSAHAAGAGLPALTAVDEGSVEPSPAALPAFLHGLPRPLRYPVAIDSTGRVADGYQVQGEPWLMLTSPTGKIVWYDAIETTRWPTIARLRAEVRTALSHRTGPTTATQLIGSPTPLARLHAQASRLIGSEPALLARIRALRGYPIVINAWASWCDPCKQEFGLFASASIQYGRQVAFLGANTDDTRGDAGAFLAQHHVSYPSYSVTSSGMRKIAPAGIEGLPTTIYIDRAGRVVDVHTGQYESQSTLDADLARYAVDSG